MVKQISVKHIACLSLLSTSMAHAAERPNIIYIFTDQHTANAMSCAGNPDLHTPKSGQTGCRRYHVPECLLYRTAQRPFTRRHVYRMLSRHNRTVGQRCSATRIAPDTNPGHTGKKCWIRMRLRRQMACARTQYPG